MRSRKRRSLSQKGAEFIGSFEGLALDAYWDSIGGVWTIGYGHTSGVRKGQRITEAQADAFLRQDSEIAANAVHNLVTVPLNQAEYDALISFTFNCGVGALEESTMRKRLNAGDRKGAMAALLWWNKGNNGAEVKGLTRRRASERDLFLRRDYEPIPA